MDKKIKEYFAKKHSEKRPQTYKNTKKMYNHFVNLTDSYLPVLVLGAGTNKYPLALMKSGFDIRVIENNKQLVDKYLEQLNDDGYIYKYNEFSKISEEYVEGSFSGIWVDNSLIFDKINIVENYMYDFYNLLDDEGYIFIKFFVSVKDEEIFGIETSSNSEYKFNKMISRVNKRVLDEENKDIIIDVAMKKLTDIKTFQVVKYSEQIDIENYGRAISVASAIIRKK